MGRIKKISGLAGLLLAGLTTGQAAAQGEFTIRTQGYGERAFADPQYWLNSTPNNRLPIHERLLVPQGGLTAWAPPSARRDGLTPWVSMALEGNRIDGVGGSALTITPGLRYRYYKRRFALEAEYAVEFAPHQRPDVDTRLIRGHGGFLSLGYRLSPTSRVSFQDILSYSRDVNNAPVQGVLPFGATTTSNTAILTYEKTLDARTGYELSWANVQHWVDAPGSVDISENTISGQMEYRLSETQSLRGFASVGQFDLGPGNANKIAADVTYRRDLGPRLTYDAKLGLLHTSEEDGRTVPNIGARVRFSDRWALYSVELARDIIAVPGLRNLVLSDELRGTALWRLDRGLMLDVSMGVQRLSIYDGLGEDITVTSAGGKLSYALSRNNWIWAELELSKERSGGQSQLDKRLIIGLSRSFD